MTNEELKKKIVEVVLNSEITGIQIRAITGGYSMANNIADALIAAGIGDVKEAELERKAYEVASNQYRIWFEEQKDRAEVAEKALLTACIKMVKYEKSDVNIELLVGVIYRKYLKQAEKELAEEEKDD